MFSADAHPLSIKGDVCVAEVLECKDLSDWANQFPIHKIQWYDFNYAVGGMCEDCILANIRPLINTSFEFGDRFLGSEIGHQVSFRAIPDGQGPTFVIPAEAVGRYIQVVAIRRIEDQVK